MYNVWQDAKAGLGTSIVRALAAQLDARVIVVDASPGVQVSLVHYPDRIGLNGLVHREDIKPV